MNKYKVIKKGHHFLEIGDVVELIEDAWWNPEAEDVTISYYFCEEKDIFQWLSGDEVEPV